MSSSNLEEDEIKKGMMGLLSGRKPQDTNIRSKVSELFGSSSEEEEEEEENSSEGEIKVTNSPNKYYSSSSSSSEEDDDEDEFADEWGPDLMGDQEDRDSLFNLPEIEREAILYERAQIRQTKSEKRDLERKMKELEKRSSGKSSKKTNLTTNTTTTITSSNKKKSSLDALKKARIDKSKRRHHKSSDDELYQEDGEIKSKKKTKHRHRSSSSSSSSSHSSSSDFSSSEEIEVDEEYSLKKDDHASSPLSLEDANCLLLKRNSVAKWIYHPQFADLSRGMLMRLAIGIGKDSCQVYRVVEVREIVTYHRQYKINDITTNKAALLRYGKQERVFRLDVISNSSITENEFSRWMEVCKEDGLPILNKYSSSKRLESYYNVIEGKALSDDIVTKMIAAKKDSLGIGNCSRNLIAEREILLSLRNEAIAGKEGGWQEEVDRINKEIELIDKNLPRNSSNDKHRNIYKKTRLLDPKLSSSTKDGEGGEHKHDPFSRRRCQPTNLSSLLSNTDKSVINDKIITDNHHHDNVKKETKEDSKMKKLSDAHDFEFDI